MATKSPAKPTAVPEVPTLDTYGLPNKFDDGSYFVSNTAAMEAASELEKLIKPGFDADERAARATASIAKAQARLLLLIRDSHDMPIFNKSNMPKAFQDTLGAVYRHALSGVDEAEVERFEAKVRTTMWRWGTEWAITEHVLANVPNMPQRGELKWSPGTGNGVSLLLEDNPDDVKAAIKAEFERNVLSAPKKFGGTSTRGARNTGGTNTTSVVTDLAQTEAAILKEDGGLSHLAGIEAVWKLLSAEYRSLKVAQAAGKIDGNARPTIEEYALKSQAIALGCARTAKGSITDSEVEKVEAALYTAPTK